MTLIQEAMKAISMVNWNPDSFYKRDTIVLYEDQIFKAISDNIGQLPINSVNWIALR